MSKQVFALATVLRVRGIEEQLARGQVAEARAAEAAEVAATAVAASAYHALPEAVGDGAVAGFLADRSRRMGLAHEALSADARRAAATEVVVGTRQQWQLAAMRLAALERLAGRAQEAHRRELLASDQRTADETGTALRAGRATS
jgi:hypothetical protein